ncbi:MAG: hypothetical protein WAL63_16135 [Solirubrobacteraceae bacterium]
MNGPDKVDDDLSDAERALNSHLELLRVSPPAPAAGVIARIIHRARWQRLVRRPLVAVAAVAAAAVDAVRLLFAGRRRP